MRKLSFLFVAGAVMALASCQNDNAVGDDQATIDSMVNVRVEEMRLEMMMQNDSIINSLAAIRADSIIAAMKGGNTVTTRTNTTRTTTVKGSSGSGGAKRTETETIGSGKPKMGESNSGSKTIGSGKPKMGETNNDSKTIGTGKPKMGDNN